MFNRLGTLFPGAALALMFATMPVEAATMTYTDVTSWSNALTGSPANITFTGAAAGGSVPYNSSTGYVSSGVSFIGFNGMGYSLSVYDSQHLPTPYYNFGGGQELVGPAFTSSSQTYIHVILPAGVTAIAANLATFSPGGTSFQVALADGESFTAATFPQPALGFFGVTTDNPILYVNFAPTSTGASPLIKNFEFGTASTTPPAPPPPDTPEAATLIMIGTGLMAFRGLRKYTNLLGIEQT